MGAVLSGAAVLGITTQWKASDLDNAERCRDCGGEGREITLHDFVVRFREPEKQWRTPKHIHLIVELYVKEAYNKELTHQLRDHLLQVFQAVQPIVSYPPDLQFFKPEHAQPFEPLNAVGEMSVEFLLVVSELIFIQEKTNYQGGFPDLQALSGFRRQGSLYCSQHCYS
jgi:hypothetical protein